MQRGWTFASLRGPGSAMVLVLALLLFDEPVGSLDALSREQVNVEVPRICGECAGGPRLW